MGFYTFFVLFDLNRRKRKRHTVQNDCNVFVAKFISATSDATNNDESNRTR